MIWIGLNWSLELYQQADKRLYRQGQTEKVIILHKVVEDGVDEDVMAALEDMNMESLEMTMLRDGADYVVIL